MREWVTSRLGIGSVPEPVWARIERSGLLDGSEERGEAVAAEVADLLAFAEAMTSRVADDHDVVRRKQREKLEDRRHRWGAYKLARQAAEESVRTGDPAGSDQIQQVEASGGRDPLIDRSDAFSLYVSRLASARSSVRAFRRHVWSLETPLTNAQAQFLRRSPAAATLPLSWFEARGVPISGHSSELVSLESPASDHPAYAAGRVAIFSDGETFEATFDDLRYPYATSGRHETYGPVLCGSVLARLYGCARKLRETLPWNALDDPTDVETFVLTDRAPWISPLRASYLKDTVELSAWPWVPVGEVYDLFDAIRKQLAPSQVTAPRRLRLVDFVLTHPNVVVAENGELAVPTWRTLQDDWNTRYPDDHKWRYTDVRNFRRAVEETLTYLRRGVSQ